jgi:putative membrane protein
MYVLNARRLFIHSTVFALALGVSVFTYAQDASVPAGGSSSTKSDTGAKSSKKSKGTAADEKGEARSGSASAKVPASDKMFMKKAAEGGLAEVELGKLAAEKGSNDAVKQFGQKMVDDHSKANDELKSLAEQKGVTLPTKPDAQSLAFKARLEKLSGAQFDKAYMEHMVRDHTKDVAEFKREAEYGKDLDVKAWAAKTQPTLEGHLSTAKEDLASVRGSSQGTEAKGMKKGKKTASGEMPSK